MFINFQKCYQEIPPILDHFGCSCFEREPSWLLVGPSLGTPHLVSRPGLWQAAWNSRLCHGMKVGGGADLGKPWIWHWMRTSFCGHLVTQLAAIFNDRILLCWGCVNTSGPWWANDWWVQPIWKKCSEDVIGDHTIFMVENNIYSKPTSDIMWSTQE